MNQRSPSGFLGYARAEGPPGIRNRVLVLSAELSVNPWVRAIVHEAEARDAEAYDAWVCGVVHKQGLGNFREDQAELGGILEGLVTHPNTGAVLVVASGNECFNVDRLADRAASAGRPVMVLSPARSGRSPGLLAKAQEAVRSFREELRESERTPFRSESLRIGLNCAGTDLISAQTSNLLCGAAMDRIIEGGGSVILSEVPEMVGLGEALYGRCVDERTAESLRAAVARQEAYLTADGGGLSENELCAFNTQGGIGSLQEKARISVLKGGHSPICGVTEYGCPPGQRGLTVMDGPAMTDFVLTGLLGAGAHLMVNCCGGGLANEMPVVVGADSLPGLMPVIKCSGSSRHAASGENRIDFDAGRLLEQPGLLEQLADELVSSILLVASGEPTRTEDGELYWMNYPLKYHQA